MSKVFICDRCKKETKQAYKLVCTMFHDHNDKPYTSPNRHFDLCVDCTMKLECFLFGNRYEKNKPTFKYSMGGTQ